MIYLIKKLSLIPIIVLVLFVFFGNYANAAGAADALDGLDKTATKAFGPEIPMNTAANNPGATIGKIVGTALSFVGILFLILMIYGGLIWMTAGGNEQKVGKAKELIISAIIGLIIIFAAYAITTLIGGELTKT